MAAISLPSLQGVDGTLRAPWLGLFLMGTVLFAGPAVSGEEIEVALDEPEATPRNAVTRLKSRLATGEASLEFEPEHGYLRALLRELDVPESSQVLVFSKTSLQRDRISPKTPRAIYFNDEVMVGFSLRGHVIELSAPDESIGTAYYTLQQRRDESPDPTRQTESCLVCHQSSATRGIPGNLVRSVFVDRQGLPLLAAGSFRTDHSSPLEERWGGWYVTGTSGDQQHMGNMIFPDQMRQRPAKLDSADGVNVVDLKDRFTVSMYPTPHSDIVALMVLEHQVGMLNRLARAGVETRSALEYECTFNKALDRPADARSESARSRIRNVGDAVVDYMLMGDAIRLTDRIEGTSSFAMDFAGRGPTDSKGRSLRDFDLESRLFRYPCSYLIYSRAFDSLPDEVKDHIYRRLWEILSGQAAGEDVPQHSSDDRAAIIEILRETKPGLPDDWKALPRSSR